MLHTGLIAPISELLSGIGKAAARQVAYWDAVRSVTYSQTRSRTASDCRRPVRERRAGGIA